MKNSLVLFFICLCNISTLAQTEFEKFVNLFPKCEWKEIDLECLQREKTGNPINPELANTNMWGKHSSIRKQLKYQSYTSPSPHIRVDRDNYLKYHNGFHGEFNSNQDFKSTLIPLVRIEFNANIVLLVLYYKFYDIEFNGYSATYEAYLFRKKDEKMLSAINFKGVPNATDAFLEKDTSIITYQLFDDPSDDDPNPNKIVCKVIYKIDDDGYFHQILFEDSERNGSYYGGIVKDENGIVDVRKDPSINSVVLYHIPDGSYVYIDKLKDNLWGRITLCQIGNGKEIIFKQGGYIPLSKIKK